MCVRLSVRVVVNVVSYCASRLVFVCLVLCVVVLAVFCSWLCIDCVVAILLFCGCAIPHHVQCDINRIVITYVCGRFLWEGVGFQVG